MRGVEVEDNLLVNGLDLAEVWNSVVHVSKFVEVPKGSKGDGTRKTLLFVRLGQRVKGEAAVPLNQGDIQNHWIRRSTSLSTQMIHKGQQAEGNHTNRDFTELLYLRSLRLTKKLRATVPRSGSNNAAGVYSR